MDQPPVFTDPLALRILGPHEAHGIEQDPRAGGARMFGRFLRAFLAVRSRIAEDTLASLVSEGLRQYVVLGAGFDTFAYRNPWPALRVWEVDHPATQGWKRKQLANAGITVPSPAPFVAVDFEREQLKAALERAGLDFEAPTFFSWLGVTPYLERSAIGATFALVAHAARRGGGIVFDYFVPPKSLSLVERAITAVRGRKLRAIGEPWKTYFDPPALVAEMRALGFADVTDFSPASLNERYFAGRKDGLKVANVGRIMQAVNRLRVEG
jgi:methyltransferase (TIGR00027 family)